jgi:hypothetical protein
MSDGENDNILEVQTLKVYRLEAGKGLGSEALADEQMFSNIYKPVEDHFNASKFNLMFETDFEQD